jgi:hypothetical protein
MSPLELSARACERARALRTRIARRLDHRFKLVVGLAFDDYRHEWVLSGCAVLALAAVLTPLLVLFGLKYGVIANLLDPLIENPR